MAAPPAPPRLPGKKALRWRLRPLALSAALTLTGLGCFSSQPLAADGKDSGPLGDFQLSSASLGQLTISPRDCLAGDRERFLGADFTDAAAGAVVRLVIDPLDGPAVRVFDSAAPFDKSVVFRRSECRTFHFSDESTMWRINGVQDYKLSLELDCVNKSGDSLAGRLSARHCH